MNLDQAIVVICDHIKSRVPIFWAGCDPELYEGAGHDYVLDLVDRYRKFRHPQYECDDNVTAIRYFLQFLKDAKDLKYLRTVGAAMELLRLEPTHLEIGEAPITIQVSK